MVMASKVTNMKPNKNELRNKIACYSFNGKFAEVVIGIFSTDVVKTFKTEDEAKKYVAEYNSKISI